MHDENSSFSPVNLSCASFIGSSHKNSRGAEGEISHFPTLHKKRGAFRPICSFSSFCLGCGCDGWSTAGILYYEMILVLNNFYVRKKLTSILFKLLYFRFLFTAEHSTKSSLFSFFFFFWLVEQKRKTWRED